MKFESVQQIENKRPICSREMLHKKLKEMFPSNARVLVINEYKKEKVEVSVGRIGNRLIGIIMNKPRPNCIHVKNLENKPGIYIEGPNAEEIIKFLET